MAETPEAVKPQNGMAGVLMTLAGGDNWVKILMIGGLIVNGYLTKQGSNTTQADVNKIQQTAAKQIRVIFTNQRIWASYAEATVEEHRLIMDKLGIPKEQWPRLPPINFQDWSTDTEEDDSK